MHARENWETAKVLILSKLFRNHAKKDQLKTDWNKTVSSWHSKIENKPTDKKDREGEYLSRDWQSFCICWNHWSRESYHLCTKGIESTNNLHNHLSTNSKYHMRDCCCQWQWSELLWAALETSHTELTLACHFLNLSQEHQVTTPINESNKKDTTVWTSSKSDISSMNTLTQTRQ